MKSAKKIFIPIVIVLVFVLLTAFILPHVFMTKRKKFEKAAEEHLTQKYGVKITECTEYSKENIGYESAFIDSGYFYSTPEYGTFRTDTGEEILCVNAGGMLSDDRELEDIYSAIYETLSNELGVEVRYLDFNSVNEDFDGNVRRSTGTYIERNMQYCFANTDMFVKDMFWYIGGNAEVYAVPSADTDMDKLVQAVENMRINYGLNDLSVYICGNSLRASRREWRYGTPDDGDMYLMDGHCSDLFYTVFSNKTGTRIVPGQ